MSSGLTDIQPPKCSRILVLQRNPWVKNGINRPCWRFAPSDLSNQAARCLSTAPAIGRSRRAGTPLRCAGVSDRWPPSLPLNLARRQLAQGAFKRETSAPFDPGRRGAGRDEEGGCDRRRRSRGQQKNCLRKLGRPCGKQVSRSALCWPPAQDRGSAVGSQVRAAGSKFPPSSSLPAACAKRRESPRETRESRTNTLLGIAR
jgi:hypothetical protein